MWSLFAFVTRRKFGVRQVSKCEEPLWQSVIVVRAERMDEDAHYSCVADMRFRFQGRRCDSSLWLQPVRRTPPVTLQADYCSLLQRCRRHEADHYCVAINHVLSTAFDNEAQQILRQSEVAWDTVFLPLLHHAPWEGTHQWEIVCLTSLADKFGCQDVRIHLGNVGGSEVEAGETQFHCPVT